MDNFEKNLSKTVESYNQLRREIAKVCADHHDAYEEVDPQIVVLLLLEMSVGLYLNLEGASKPRFMNAADEAYKIMTKTHPIKTH
jgi:hypothetical protein